LLEFRFAPTCCAADWHNVISGDQFIAEVPADVVEDVNHLETWMQKAIDVAARAKRGKPKRSR
jgi:hypothetical protein